MAKKKNNNLGHIAFVVAVVLALLLGLLQQMTLPAAGVLVLLGLIVGLLNVQKKETHEFLIGGTVLVIVSSLGGGELGVLPPIAQALQGLLYVFVPATVVVALKEMMILAKS